MKEILKIDIIFTVIIIALDILPMLAVSVGLLFAALIMGIAEGLDE